jgi:glycerol-3-phosphate acyltransferase PlsY
MPPTTLALYALGFGLLGYLSGSLPFAIWVTRQVRGVDVRDAGSGHATTTNTIRQAGFGPGALVLILDIFKGWLPTWLALHYAPAAWIPALTAALVVGGHCWPLFAGFRGGMGLASAGGCLLAVSFLGAILSLGVLVSLTLIMRHSARASLVTGLLMPLVLWLFGLHAEVLWIAVAVGLVIVVRFPINWNRRYRELWLDRDPPR